MSEQVKYACSIVVTRQEDGEELVINTKHFLEFIMAVSRDEAEGKTRQLLRKHFLAKDGWDTLVIVCKPITHPCVDPDQETAIANEKT